MTLSHEKLDVYRLTLDFVVFANEVITALPRGRSYVADQLTRASISIALNIAEGLGKPVGPDQRRFYMIARGSGTESAALMDVLCGLRLIEEAKHREGKAMLERVVAMLYRLAASCVKVNG